MQKTKSLYRGHRFPAAIISQAVPWYFRLQLSLRDIAFGCLAYYQAAKAPTVRFQRYLFAVVASLAVYVITTGLSASQSRTVQCDVV